jgi:hypothetical protein
MDFGEGASMSKEEDIRAADWHGRATKLADALAAGKDVGDVDLRGDAYETLIPGDESDTSFDFTADSEHGPETLSAEPKPSNGHIKTARKRQSKQPKQLCNYEMVEVTSDDGNVNEIPVGLSAAAIHEQLLELTTEWPKRVGQLLFARADDTPLYFEKPQNLFAWINPQFTERQNAVTWRNGANMIPKTEFFAYLQQGAENFDAVEAYPHWPELPGHYYCHPPIAKGDGRALTDLVSRFCPETEEDGSLITGLFLSLFTGLPPGQRPGWLVTASEDDPHAGRGVGKSTLIEMGGRLVGGVVSYSPTDDVADFKKRLLSPEARNKRAVLIDNIKSLKFSHAELEALITCDIVSGRQMYVGEGRRPNTFLWGLTINAAALSKDLAQRCVILKLKRPAYTGDWEGDITKFIEKHRWTIIADCIAMLRSCGVNLQRHSRWGLWEEAVLAKLPNPSRLQEVILERQDAIDEDQSELDLVRDAIIEALRQQSVTATKGAYFISSAKLAEIVNLATNEKRPTAKVTAYVQTLGIRELRKSKHDGCRGWVWTGADAPSTATATKVFW